MRYLTDTERLNCNIYTNQKKTLQKVKVEILKEHDIKVPISELVRRALEIGIPAIEKDQSFVMELKQ
jgi:hypothetical protein